MASPLTHIILTDKIFNKYFSNRNRKDFFIGTCFPDIRFLGVIKREKTHFMNLKLSNLVNENDFFAGLKFHSILDEVEEKFMSDSNIYNLYATNYSDTCVKFLEDITYYDYIKNIEEYIKILNEIKFEESSLVKSSYVKEWHCVLQEYFYQKPDDSSISKFIERVGMPKETIDEIINNINMMKDNKIIKNTIDKFYKDFDILLRNNDKEFETFNL